MVSSLKNSTGLLSHLDGPIGLELPGAMASAWIFGAN
jgi:hypothetical protein